MANVRWLVVALVLAPLPPVNRPVLAGTVGDAAPPAPAIRAASPHVEVEFGGGTSQCWGPIDPSRLPAAEAGVLFGQARSLAPTAQVQIGSPVVIHGSLRPAMVRRYLRRNHARFEYCYHHALLDTPTLAGDLTVTFGIDGDGRVVQVEAAGLGGDLARCARAVVERIQFPSPLEGGAVRARFRLSMTLPTPRSAPP
ncbi:MAG: AgmX/PglI C-terminal domain-containing protein [Kofleriaceae bacterium]|nr:AgmX/PglI C-terminal domain-containing protein [Kofleriaceae bacterium]MBP6841011.1 AgmX/PglI C-terminal domain-containing protein [Kofleriaceae bacterium]MBP9202699.1 AgmX/PglI C-terminal domain-containing protein [Kofleriaceae bacterium]